MGREYKILPLNTIAACGLDKFDCPGFSVEKDCDSPDGIILRSYNMHEMELPASLKAVSRAGAGTNNIPVEACSERGIVVFNTPGANANAVKELVLTGMLLSSRRVIEGIEWAKTLAGREGIPALVEKGKSDFVGPELRGKKLGVIGLGATGALVANAGVVLKMEVFGHDPFLSVDAAWSLSRAVTKAPSVEALVSECDYISLHVPCTDKTRGMYNKALFDITKKDARLLNFSRGELVDNAALAEALEGGRIACYVTDFPDEDVLSLKNTICIPHLGASTPESEENCAEMAAEELKNYLLYGIIRNSINFPTCEMPYTGQTRLSVLHKNIPNMVGSVTAILAKNNINIDNMSNQSRKEWACTLIDLDGGLGSGDIAGEIRAVDGVVSVRVIGG